MLFLFFCDYCCIYTLSYVLLILLFTRYVNEEFILSHFIHCIINIKINKVRKMYLNNLIVFFSVAACLKFKTLPSNIINFWQDQVINFAISFKYYCFISTLHFSQEMKNILTQNIKFIAGIYTNIIIIVIYNLVFWTNNSKYKKEHASTLLWHELQWSN